MNNIESPWSTPRGFFYVHKSLMITIDNTLRANLMDGISPIFFTICILQL